MHHEQFYQKDPYIITVQYNSVCRSSYMVMELEVQVWVKHVKLAVNLFFFW